MNFEDMLKKAFDDNKSSEEDSMSSGIKAMLGFLENGSLIKLAKAAKEKMDELADQLAKDIDKTGKLVYDDTAARCRKIINTAKKIEVLHAIVMAAGVVGVSNDDGYDENIEMIIKLCTL